MPSIPILPRVREVCISVMDYLALSQMVDVFKAFQETTDILCGYTASLGCVIPDSCSGLVPGVCSDTGILPPSTDQGLGENIAGRHAEVTLSCLQGERLPHGLPV